MKPVRKSLVVTLALILMLTSININAVAIEPEDKASSPGVVVVPDTILENAAVKYIQAVQQQNQKTQKSGEADSYASRIVTVSDSPSISKDIVTAIISNTAETIKSTEQTVENISDTTAPAVINPGVVLNIGEQIAVFALKYNGYKYVYGAASPSTGFDCSGFAYYIYKQFGYALPRTAHVQYLNGTAVEKSVLQPGDLLFFATNGGRAVSHVGIYIGNNTFIHAANTRSGVVVTSLDDSYWAKAFVGAKRINSPEISLALI